MGATNGKTLTCPLCHNDCQNQLTLNCGHSFCQACIRELWSGCPSGPYYCPECRYEHQTLPEHTDSASTSVAATLRTHWGGKQLSKHSKKLHKKRKFLSAFPGGGYRLGKAPFNSFPRNSDVINIADSEEETSAPKKKRATRDELASEIPSPSGVFESNSISDTSSPSTSTTQQMEKDQPNTSKSSMEISAAITQSNSPARQEKDQEDAQTLSQRNSFPCHYCPNSNQKAAVKTCLVCGASMCSEHLQDHLDKPVFQNHPLVNAVEDVSLWRCQEHQDMNRIYCRLCAVCVCTVCSVVGLHKGHECISIRQAEQQLRGSLNDEIQKLQRTEKSIEEKLSELREKRLGVQTDLEKVRGAVLHQYQAMRQALEQEEEQALLCVSQEEEKVKGSIENQLSSLQGGLMSIQNILNTLSGMCSAEGASQYKDQAFIMQYSKIIAQLSGLSDPLLNLKAPEEINQERLECLNEWTEGRLETVLITLPHRDPFRLLYGISPTLDPNTIHPKLLLLNENRTVQYSEAPQEYSETDVRFSVFPQVLGSHATRSGCCYWEVQVSLDEGRWKVGVSDALIGRKSQKDVCRLGFNPNSWCLVYEKGKVEALHDKVASPVSATGLEKIGVLLDFTARSLTFFNVARDGGLSLIHSFEHTFTEPLYPALAVSKTQLSICDIFAK